MLTLASRNLISLEANSDSGICIRRITENPNYVLALRPKEYLLRRTKTEPIPDGFGGYLFLERPSGEVPKNSFLLPEAFSYLASGDIVRLHPAQQAIRILYRANSRHNSLFLTERCNHFCLMCAQPPRAVDSADLFEEATQTVALMSPPPRSICITGGEPTLLGDRLITLVQTIKNKLPGTALHILTNGCAFKSLSYSQALLNVRHPNLMLGIPLYSDLSTRHDYIVQASGSFDETIRGIINLKSLGAKIEIRIVVHKLTYERLSDLARFIRRNLTFCDHVALMGLEMTGFTRSNLEKLWIDPHEYQRQLEEAVQLLSVAKIPVSIYNHQLCLLPPSIQDFSVRSISDWKNEYMPECAGCTRKAECGGFFSSAEIRYSEHIRPFLS